MFHVRHHCSFDRVRGPEPQRRPLHAILNEYLTLKQAALSRESFVRCGGADLGEQLESTLRQLHNVVADYSMYRSLLSTREGFDDMPPAVGSSTGGGAGASGQPGHTAPVAHALQVAPAIPWGHLPRIAPGATTALTATAAASSTQPQQPAPQSLKRSRPSEPGGGVAPVAPASKGARGATGTLGHPARPRAADKLSASGAGTTAAAMAAAAAATTAATAAAPLAAAGVARVSGDAAARLRGAATPLTAVAGGGARGVTGGAGPRAGTGVPADARGIGGKGGTAAAASASLSTAAAVAAVAGGDTDNAPYGHSVDGAASTALPETNSRSHSGLPTKAQIILSNDTLQSLVEVLGAPPGAALHQSVDSMLPPISLDMAFEFSQHGDGGAAVGAGASGVGSAAGPPAAATAVASIPTAGGAAGATHSSNGVTAPSPSFKDVFSQRSDSRAGAGTPIAVTAPIGRSDSGAQLAASAARATATAGAGVATAAAASVSDTGGRLPRVVSPVSNDDSSGHPNASGGAAASGGHVAVGVASVGDGGAAVAGGDGQLSSASGVPAQAPPSSGLEVLVSPADVDAFLDMVPYSDDEEEDDAG